MAMAATASSATLPGFAERPLQKTSAPRYGAHTACRRRKRRAPAVGFSTMSLTARSRPNTDERFTVDVRDYSQLRSAFEKILQVFERADEEP